MKKLGRDSGGKRFFAHPRRLFAGMFLTIEKDITKLADALGYANLTAARIHTLSSGVEHRKRTGGFAAVLPLSP